MAQRAAFPESPDVFEKDDRVSFSKTSGSYLLEDELGEEWEWLPGPRKWTRTMDEALMKQQAEIYKIPGVDDDAPALDPAKKRKAAQEEDSNANKRTKADSSTNANSDATGPAKKPRPSTAVFVTGLPQDVDTEEVRDVFQKYGIIAESAENDEKRIKLYNDEHGNFKGEALIVYLLPQSVYLAVEMLDGAEFPREPDVSTTRISVEEADTSYKRSKDDTVAEERTGYKPKPSKALAKKKAEQMQQRLTDWDSDGEPSTTRQTSSRFDKVVVLRNVFTLKQIKSEEDLIEELEEDMKEEGEEFGAVKNVTIFDQEEDGVVTVRFSDAAAAKAFRDKCDGRAFDGRTLKASIATGMEKFQKTRRTDKDKEEEEAKRLEEYSAFIEDRAKAGGGADT